MKENRQLKKLMLQECAKMWDWLSEHPSAHKEEYFRTHPEVYPAACGCFMCEYTFSIDDETEDCNIICPISPLVWPHGCTDSDSVYMIWRNPMFNVDRRIEAAKQIADACREVLKEMEVEDGQA